jgi:hypothetical protein
MIAAQAIALSSRPGHRSAASLCVHESLAQQDNPDGRSGRSAKNPASFR